MDMLQKHLVFSQKTLLLNQNPLQTQLKLALEDLRQILQQGLHGLKFFRQTCVFLRHLGRLDDDLALNHLQLGLKFLLPCQQGFTLFAHLGQNLCLRLPLLKVLTENLHLLLE